MAVRFSQLVIGSLAVLCSALSIVPTAEGQEPKSANIASVAKSAAAPSSNAKRELFAAIERSKVQVAISRMIQISVQGKQVDSRFDYVAPGRFRLFETLPGAEDREAVEVAKQRFQKSKGQWVKVRMDPYPLREQFFDLFFPAKFIRHPTDVFKMKSSPVTSLGVEEKDGKKFVKYRYQIIYSDAAFNDSGIAWVDQATGLLEFVETEGIGLAGKFTAVWKYDYDQTIAIESPESFIEKDWIN